MTRIQIDIISDVICPWCYIGYRTLQRAIALYRKTYPGGSSDEICISWKPYFIDRAPPAQSELINDRMLRRMQSPPQVAAAQSRLKRAGKEVGIQLSFAGYLGSSRLAHRLLHIAAEEKGNAVQCQLAEELFRLQFECERDVSELVVLLEAAAKVGLDEEEVRGWLDGTRGIAEIESEESKMREKGSVQGVPHFVIGESHLEGAVDVGELMGALIAVREREEGK